MASIIFALFGFCLGVFVVTGGGLLSGAFQITPWLNLWWGTGATIYTIIKDYWMPGGKGYGYQPQWRKAILLTLPWGIALNTGINFVIYFVLHWTIHFVRG